MTIEIQASDLNQDGSVSVTIDGKSVKLVKESDLGAVKAQLKDKGDEVTKLQTDVASVNMKVSDYHQDVLKERASKETFEKSAGESDTLKTEVEGLKTKVADLEKAGGENATKLTDRVKLILTDGFKVDPEKIKEMALEDLERTEQALILTGAVPKPANYDGKGGGSGSSPDDLAGKSPLALATLGYEQDNKNK